MKKTEKLTNETELKQTLNEDAFLVELKDIIISARRLAYSSVNFAQVQQNWLIGQKIVMQEQRGKARAGYGKRIVKKASEALTTEFGKGFSERNLWKYKQFFLTFKDLPILPTRSAKYYSKERNSLSSLLPLLSWSHYERLMRITNDEERLQKRRIMSKTLGNLEFRF